MWVNNPNYVRRNHEVFLAATTEERKVHALRVMAIYDKLPRKARDAVKEYGQLKAAVKCRSRKAADKAAAVQAAYARNLERISIQI